MSKSEFLKVRVDQENLAAIDILVAATGTSRSAVLRDLIPQVLTANALVEFEATRGKPVGDDGHHRPSSYQPAAAHCVEDHFVNSGLAYRMMEDREHPIPQQVEVVYGYGSRRFSHPYAMIPGLFVTWARAIRGEKGYSFKKVHFQGKPRWEIAVGPGDSPEEIADLMYRMCDLAKKFAE